MPDFFNVYLDEAETEYMNYQQEQVRFKLDLMQLLNESNELTKSSAMILIFPTPLEIASNNDFPGPTYIDTTFIILHFFT